MSDIITIEISPLDTLFFRDGKPFSAGSESWADGIFPPAPSVFFGALKTLYASQNGWNLASINKNTEGLEICNIYFLKGGKIYLPCPSDFVFLGKDDATKEKEEKIKKYEAHLLNPLTIKGIVASSDISNFISCNLYDKEITVEDHSMAIISTTYFKPYLNEADSSVNIEKLSDFLDNEPKVGTERTDELHTVEDSQLYRVDLKRLKPEMKICVEFKAPPESDICKKILPEGFIKLGGEGKTASYKILESVSFANEIKKQNIKLRGKYFKVYLATPCFFKEGWKPCESSFKNATLVAAKVNKPTSIGGFNMQTNGEKKKGHKPMYKAVPAGSIYIYHTEDESLLRALEQKQGQSICEFEHRKNEGFGIAFFANVQTSDGEFDEFDFKKYYQAL